MAGFYGSFVARTVTQGSSFAPVGSWLPLQAAPLVAGSNPAATPLANRTMIRLAPRGRDTILLALQYVARGADGTFQAPTGPAYGATTVPSTGLYVEPLGDNITIYGRAVQRGGTSGGVKVVVTEYA